MSSEQFTHLSPAGDPGMVDITGKDVTAREAIAEGYLVFPEPVWSSLEANGFATKKGSIFDVARIGGTMAVKKTPEIIPFCHAIPVEGCRFEFETLGEERKIRVECSMKTTARTGIEMEAIHGASAACLVIYDMTKSLGQGAVLEGIRLLRKSGGKSDFSV